MARFARSRGTGILPWLALLLVLVGRLPVYGQPPQKETSLEAIQSRLKKLDAEIQKDADDKIKPEVRKWYKQAAEHLMSEAATREATRRLNQRVAGAAEEVQRIRSRIQALPDQPILVLPADADLDQRLSATIKERNDAVARRDAVRKEDEQWTQRLRALPQAQRAAEKRLVEIEGELKQPPEGEPPEVTKARQAALAAQRQMLQQQLARYKAEAAADEVVRNLLDLQLKLATAEANLAEQTLKQFRDEIAKLRRYQAETKLKEARAEADRHKHRPGLHALAQGIVTLAEERVERVAATDEALREWERRQQELEELRAAIASTQRKVEAVGLTHSVAQLLRTQRDALPSIEQYRHSIRVRQEKIGQARLKLLEGTDERRAMQQRLDARNDDGPLVQEELEKALQGLPEAERESKREAYRLVVRDLLEMRQAYLEEVISERERYFNQLVNLDVEEQTLIAEIERFAQFIDERILWVRSVSPLSADPRADLVDAGKAALWLFDPQSWADIGRALLANVTDDFSPVAVLLLLILIGWLGLGPRLRRRLAELGQIASARTTQSFWPTMEAVLHTSLIVALYPAWLWYLAWVIRRVPTGSDLPVAVSTGLSTAAWVLVPLATLRYICRSQGLGGAHFQWPVRVLTLVRSRVRQLMVLGIPLVYVAAALTAQKEQRFDTSLGRLAFIASMLLAGLAAHSVLRPKGVLWQQLAVKNRTGWLYRLRFVLYAIGVFCPLAEAVLAGVGFYYTAWQLALHLQTTVVVVLTLLILHALVLRWLVLNHRRLAMEQRRQALKEKAQGTESAAAPEGAGIVTELPPEIDITAVSEQTHRLLNLTLAIVAAVALWWIWSGMLPALNLLNEIKLRPTTLTLGQVVLAALAFALTVVAGRNVPGLLQFAILQRLPLDPGVRYAIDSVSRYLITIIGVIASFSILGVGWEKIQWLVAAVSVGLGFGLQEIFANFVSGLIILFEQPIRVGDVVTIDTTTGIVSKIRIRATTITNWDRQELIIPNKDFITGRLLNWTLSDNVNRVVVTVGVAYGSDTQAARDLLMRIARDHPQILDEPEPRVTFETFADSTLNFVVRAYLANLDKRLDTIHELHCTIHNKFAAAGIEIAFPQRDIHIRSAVAPAASRVESAGVESAA